jgi:hypothetical protein
VAVQRGVSEGRKTVRRLIALFIALLLATAAAAGAGDDIKWCKSKKITYYSPATNPSQFGKNTTHIAKKYRLTWSPYFNNNLDHIAVRWSGWEWFATKLNSALEHGNLPLKEYEKGIAEGRGKREKYLIFEVTVAAKTEEFYKLATEDYWEFRIITGEGELKPIGVEGKGALRGKTFASEIGSVGASTYITDKLYCNDFTVYFENPYKDTTPETLKFVISGEEIKRGFEWRFKE